MAVLDDLTGRQFERLTVIRRAPSKGGLTRWTCQCSCEKGTIIDVIAADLKRGHTKSCGCLKREQNKETMEQRHRDMGHEIHGMSRTKLYYIWINMKAVCESVYNNEYVLYGARGIRVCNSWSNSFIEFYNWAINNGYREGLTLDRINNNGHFEPKNCRWATMEVQNNNKRNNRVLTFNGMTKTASQWAKYLGISRDTLIWRLNNGWSVQQALTTPVKQHRKR